MILLKRIVEQMGTEGQYYDLGGDFSNFRKAIDGNTDQIKKQFETAIGSKLNGKRVVAQASRGYKQYVKNFEFDIVRVTIDDYYDNYVVVAQDNSTPKPKEYFLSPKYKIQILGMATGQPSPQKGDKPGDQKPKQEVPTSQTPVTPQTNPDAAQSQPMAPVGNAPSETPIKEDEEKVYEGYSIDTIEKDIASWMTELLLKPKTPLRDFVKEIGMMKRIGNGKIVALYDLILPINALKEKLTPTFCKDIIDQINLKNKANPLYTVTKMELNDAQDEWNIRIKKTGDINNKNI